MQVQTNDTEDITANDFTSTASWERERQDEELNSFISRRLEAVGGEVDV